MVDPLPEDAPQRVSRTLSEIVGGRPEASAELLPLLYEDLRQLAAARLARLAPGQTVQATELVHEAYVRLVGTTDPGWQGRAHFFGAAARAMRDVLADHLQRKASLKRGGHLRRIDGAEAAEIVCHGTDEDVLAVEEALQELERDFPRQAEVVTLSFFGGLATAEIAEALQLSSRTVERDWRFARAWLNGRLREKEPGE